VTRATIPPPGGTISFAGDPPLHRMGYGAMRLTGPGIWGDPEDPEIARAVLRRAYEIGVDFIDTADSYGPEVSERLIGEAFDPYPEGLVVATKGGAVRPGPNQWMIDARPERLREACEASMRRLRVDRIYLYQLHAVDPKVPLAESVGALKELRDEGRIRHVGLSNVKVDQLDEAREIVPIESVQNRYSLTDRGSDDVLAACERDGTAFIPYFPLAAGKLTQHGRDLLDRIAAEHDATPGQVALAWLLERSPVIVPIPGTSKGRHLEENVAAATLDLTRSQVEELTALA
jgi:pyridoxine 4-dehydrogenase